MNNLKPLIDKLTELISKGDNFVSGQIPDVAQQILKYKFWQSLIWGSLFLVVTIVLLGATWKFAISEEREEDDGNFVYVMGILISGLPFLGAIANLETCLQIHIAPKLFLLEFLKDFLK